MVEDRWKTRAHKAADPINPQYVFSELSKRLPDNCILSADSGSTAAWFARDLKIRKGMKASLSGNLATMCPGMPYTIAAKFAYPDRVPIGLIGDGAMQMLGIKWVDYGFKILETMERPAVYYCCFEQSGFEHGNMGTKSNGRRSKI